ncbi:MAG: mevalonate kinase [Microgenomates group bacterium]
MRKITYSAPGKVILSGEHAVVYGKPALVCAIDKRLTLTLIEAETTRYTDTVMPIVERTVREFLKQRKEEIKKGGYTYTISSTIPMGRGLGSSAAYSATIAAGLLELFTGREWSIPEINICAYKIEKYFHKNSSGVDTSTSVMGGLIYYRKEFEFLKTISSLSVKIPKRFTDMLLLIDTGKPVESTGDMVQQVGSLFNAHPTKVEGLLNEVEKITKRFVVSLMKEDSVLFQKSIQENEKALEKLGVVSPSTILLLKKLKKIGVGKVTGGGGKTKSSGYVLFATDAKKEVEPILEKEGLIHTSLVPSYIGLKKEL